MAKKKLLERESDGQGQRDEEIGKILEEDGYSPEEKGERKKGRREEEGREREKATSPSL